MNEDEVSDTQMTRINEFYEDGMYSLRSCGLSGQELLPASCENPGIWSQQNR